MDIYQVLSHARMLIVAILIFGPITLPLLGAYVLRPKRIRFATKILWGTSLYLEIEAPQPLGRGGTSTDLPVITQPLGGLKPGPSTGDAPSAGQSCPALAALAPRDPCLSACQRLAHRRRVPPAVPAPLGRHAAGVEPVRDRGGRPGRSRPSRSTSAARPDDSSAGLRRSKRRPGKRLGPLVS
jgi:hypothetical protein